MKFEILERKYSSNVIVKVEEITTINGKKTIEKTIVLCPAVNKKEGDVLAQTVVDLLNHTPSDVEAPVSHNEFKINLLLILKSRLVVVKKRIKNISKYIKELF